MSNSNQRPDNHMVWAILSTIFCCLPVGIVAIINSAKVDSLWRSGDYEAAEEAAANAKKYSKWAAIIGIIGIILCVIVDFALLANLDDKSDSTNKVELVDGESSTSQIRRMLESQVNNSQEDFPMEAENGITITGISMSGDYIVHTYECDENVVSMDAIARNKKLIKESIVEALSTTTDEDQLEMNENLKKIGGGYIYKYIGDTSGDVYSIKIEADEL